jgi:hypothetical protein
MDLPSYLQIGLGPRIKISPKGLGKKTALAVEANIISKGNTFEHLNLNQGDVGKQTPTTQSI